MTEKTTDATDATATTTTSEDLPSTSPIFNSNHDGIISNLKIVFNIFFSRWRIFFPISVMQLISGLVISTVYIYGVYTNLYFDRRFLNVTESLDANNDEIYSGVGISSFLFKEIYSLYRSNDAPSSRLLEADDGYYFDYDIQTADFFAILIQIVSGASGSLIFLTFFFMILELAISSFFDGSIIRAAAESYANSEMTPLSKSFSYGLKSMKSLVTFSLLFGAIAFIVFMILVVAPLLVTNEFRLINIVCMGLFLAYVISFGTIMVAAMPSIVIEKQSGVSAFSRSFELCNKKSFAVIFGSVVALWTLGFLVTFIMTHFHPLLGVTTKAVFAPLTSILTVVLYMKLRIESEQLNQEKLFNELSLETRAPSGFSGVEDNDVV